MTIKTQDEYEELLDKIYDAIEPVQDQATDPDHYITCHADTREETFAKLAYCVRDIYDLVSEHKTNEIWKKFDSILNLDNPICSGCKQKMSYHPEIGDYCNNSNCILI